MKVLPVALQIYSVRDYAEKDFAGTVKQVREMGYDGVELAGLYGLEPGDIKKNLEEVGLTAVSAHVPVNELADDPAGTVAKYHTVGCKFIAIPYLPPDLCPDGKDFDKTVSIIRETSKACKAHGITLLYHNHDFEFNIMPDGSFGLDYLYAQIPADVIQTELDTCWIRFAGQDPAAYVRKYAGRCPLVHLKDFYKEGEAEGMYDLIGEEKKTAKDRRGNFEFRPVGHGVQDFPPILEASAASGAQWVIVEQDASVGRTTLEAAKMSRAYLKSQGW